MPEHKKVNYPVVKYAEDADAAAWVFTSKNSFVKQYVRLPDLKSDEIRGRVLYTSLCHTDCKMGRGKWGDIEYPICPGHEVIARVIKKGIAVTHLEVGDIVGIGPFVRSCGECRFCKNDWNQACENLPFEDRFIHYYRFGGFATHIQQPAKYCVKIPDGIELNKASPLLCAGLTVFTPMNMYIKKEDKVAVMGCGGLGHLAVQFAKVMAKEVTVITHSKDKINYIKQLNPDKIVLQDDFLKNISDFKFDVIVNTLSVWPKREHVKKWVDSLANYGRLIVLGGASKNEPMNINASWLTLKNNVVIVSCAGGLRQMKDMFDFVAKNNIHCFCEFYDFEHFDKALQKLEKGEPHFRIVVDAESSALDLEKKHK